MHEGGGGLLYKLFLFSKGTLTNEILGTLERALNQNQQNQKPKTKKKS